MNRARKKYILWGAGAILLVAFWIYSYFSPATLRWTHREPLSAQQIMDAPPGRPVAETWEIGVIGGRIRWMENNWLSTPHVATGDIVGVRKRNGLSLSLRDALALPIDREDLDWHFAGFGAGHPVYFQDDETADVEAEGLWEINSTEVCVPMWALAAVWMIPMVPMVWRGRKRDGMHCPECGYDLRATPGRCPECGWGYEEIRNSKLEVRNKSK